MGPAGWVHGKGVPDAPGRLSWKSSEPFREAPRGLADQCFLGLFLSADTCDLEVAVETRGRVVLLSAGLLGPERVPE